MPRTSDTSEVIPIVLRVFSADLTSEAERSGERLRSRGRFPRRLCYAIRNRCHALINRDVQPYRLGQEEEASEKSCTRMHSYYKLPDFDRADSHGLPEEANSGGRGRDAGIAGADCDRDPGTGCPEQ